MRICGIEILNLDEPQIKEVESLPLHHRDPFDRLLIAAAITNNLTILTSDEVFHKYDVPVIW